ncbi:MAG: VWA domain-containing protein [Spirochaetaceae bacterium]|jgi:Ca-activated chloride channel family protein|nr:VWA domain-containing protein [Spirochaetaceae bacterium]
MNTSSVVLHWTHREFFYYFLGLIPLAALLFIHYKRRFPVVSAFVSGQGSRRISALAIKLRWRYFFSSLFFLLFIAALIAAFAAPRTGTRLVREFRRGCDVVFALDISRSMLARDSVPLNYGSTNSASSRLERGIWLAQSLIAASGDEKIMANFAAGGASVHLRFGVAFGKGHSVLAVPLTQDLESVRSLLDSLSSDSMSSRGTNLELLISSASEGFLETAPAGRVIILLSDGEGLSGSLVHAVEQAKRKDITVIAVGLGSPAGMLVRETGEQDNGDFVRSFLHSDALRGAVERFGGFYIDGNNDGALRLLAEKIFPLAGASSWIFREENGSQWYICVIAALVFLGLCYACGLKPR